MRVNSRSQRSSSPTPAVSLSFRSALRSTPEESFETHLVLPRTDTGYSTASETRREYSWRTKLQNLLQFPDNNNDTMRSLPGSHFSNSHVLNRKFEIENWYKTPRQNRVTDFPDNQLSLRSNLTSHGLTARKFAELTKMNVMYLSDAEEERQQQTTSILDPNFFLPPNSSTNRYFKLSESNKISQPDQNAIPNSNVNTVLVELPRMSEPSVNHLIPVQARPSTDSTFTSPTSSPRTSTEVHYVKVGRFLVSVDESLPSPRGAA
ncbi:hypothetical protein HK096_009776 [Nowakowskiella sp. JEL0078]|nr:hypothetical protein HK096_009776 [Nowakowskiella sp. JEL0078]